MQRPYRERTHHDRRPALRARGPCGRQAGKGGSSRRGVVPSCGRIALRPYDGRQYMLWESMRILYGRNVMRPRRTARAGKRGL